MPFGGIPVAETQPSPTAEETPPAAPSVPQEEFSPPAPEPVMTAGEYVREIVTPEPVSTNTTTPSQQPQEMAPVPLQLDWSSDLIQIETDPEKHKETFARLSEAAPQPRVKRVRPNLAPISDEPLVQVETHRNEEIADPEAQEAHQPAPEQTAATSAS